MSDGCLFTRTLRTGRSRRSACSVVLRGSTTWRAVADADVSSRFERFGASGRGAVPCTREDEHSGERRESSKAGSARGRPTAHTGGVATPVPSAPAWLDELDLKAGPPWLSMGIRTLDLDRWLVVDDRFADELDLKRRLLSERPDDVFAARPRPSMPAPRCSSWSPSWLAVHHPDVLPRPEPVARSVPQGPDRATGSGVAGVRTGGTRWMRQGGWCRRTCACWSSTTARYPLEAASLCFPSHWRLHEKLGGRWPPSTRRSPTTPRSSRPRSTPSSVGSASTARSCGATCRSTATTTSTGPSPTSRRTRSPRMPRASTRSGCAASARRSSGCPAPAPCCSPSRPSSAR